jgi:hypothetical protein
MAEPVPAGSDVSPGTTSAPAAATSSRSARPSVYRPARQRNNGERDTVSGCHSAWDPYPSRWLIRAMSSDSSRHLFKKNRRRSLPSTRPETPTRAIPADEALHHSIRLDCWGLSAGRKCGDAPRAILRLQTPQREDRRSS